MKRNTTFSSPWDTAKAVQKEFIALSVMTTSMQLHDDAITSDDYDISGCDIIGRI